MTIILTLRMCFTKDKILKGISLLVGLSNMSLVSCYLQPPLGA